MPQTKAYFHSIRDTVSLQTLAYIDGQFCDAADGAKLENSVGGCTNCCDDCYQG